MDGPRPMNGDNESRGTIRGEGLSYVQYREAQHEQSPDLRKEYRRLGPRFEVLNQLIKARTKAKMTQADLALQMDTTRSAISRLEAGHHSPSIDTIVDAAAALGLDVVIKLVKHPPRDK